MKATNRMNEYVRILLFVGFLSILMNVQPSFLASAFNAYAQENESDIEVDSQVENSNDNDEAQEQEREQQEEEEKQYNDVQEQDKNDNNVEQEGVEISAPECGNDQSFSEEFGICFAEEDNGDSFQELEDDSDSLDLFNNEGSIAQAEDDSSFEEMLESVISFPEENPNVVTDPTLDEEQTQSSVQDKGKSEAEMPPMLFFNCVDDRHCSGGGGPTFGGPRTNNPYSGSFGSDARGPGGIPDQGVNTNCFKYRDFQAQLCPDSTPKTGEHNSGDGSGVICPSDMKETESPESLHCKLQKETGADESNGGFASKLVDGVRDCTVNPNGPFCSLADNGRINPGNGGADPGNGGADPGNGGADPGNGGAQTNKESFSRTTISNRYQTVNNNSPPAENMMSIHRTQVNSVQCPTTNAETKTLRYDQLSFSDKGFMPIVEISPHHIVCGHILIIGPGSITGDLKVIAIHSSSVDSQTSIQHAINMNPTKNIDPKTGRVNYVVDLKPVITGINPFTGMPDAMFHATGILLFNGNNNNSINNSGYDSENSFKDTRLLTKIVFQ